MGGINDIIILSFKYLLLIIHLILYMICTITKVSLRAFFDYNPLQDPLIPCKEVGISFSAGDVLHVVNMDDANWWQVSLIVHSQ